MWNLPQQKENLLKALETPVKEPQNDNQPEEEIGEASLGGKSKYRTPTFLLTFEIFNYNAHKYFVESRASVNVMPLSVCNQVNGQPKPTTSQVLQLDRTSVKVIGEMEDVMISLSAYERVCQYIDIVVADIPDSYIWFGFEPGLVSKIRRIFCIRLVICGCPIKDVRTK